LGLTGLGAAVLRQTVPEVRESRAHGVSSPDNAFNNDTWRDNPALQYWRAHTPAANFLVFSNEPDGVALLTRHAVAPAPRRTSGPYGTTVMGVEDFIPQLFDSGMDVYLIWIEPSSYEYYYAPEKLAEIAEVESVFTSEEGKIYRLRPRGPS
jgi:hypothetical protein